MTSSNRRWLKAGYAAIYCLAVFGFLNAIWLVITNFFVRPPLIDCAYRNPSGSHTVAILYSEDQAMASIYVPLHGPRIFGGYNIRMDRRRVLGGQWVSNSKFRLYLTGQGPLFEDRRPLPTEYDMDDRAGVFQIEFIFVGTRPN